MKLSFRPIFRKRLEDWYRWFEYGIIETENTQLVIYIQKSEIGGIYVAIKQTWHVLFYTKRFTAEQVHTFVDDLKKEPNFGGFPIEQVTFDYTTKEMLYTTFIFTAPQAVDQKMQHEMAKYLYARVVHPGGLDTKQYYEVLNQSSQELGIEYYDYGNGTLDIMLWGQQS